MPSALLPAGAASSTATSALPVCGLPAVWAKAQSFFASTSEQFTDQLPCISLSDDAPPGSVASSASAGDAQPASARRYR